MFSRRDLWCGLVQRAASGFDLFLLEGFPSAVRDSQQRFPTRYTRLQNWPEGGWWKGLVWWSGVGWSGVRWGGGDGLLKYGLKVQFRASAAGAGAGTGTGVIVMGDG